MPTYDVLAIGNAIVDVISHATDEFLIRHDLKKDSMELVDAERSDALYAAMGPTIETSGGSVANTAGRCRCARRPCRVPRQGP